MIAQTNSIDAEGNLASIAVSVFDGLPSFDIIGVAGERVRETRDRVRAAMIASGVTWPNRRITVGVAPQSAVTERPISPRYDLAIALCIAAAHEPFDVRLLLDILVVGELHLDGGLCRVTYTHDNRLDLVPLCADDQDLAQYDGPSYLVPNLAEAVSLLNRLERVR